MRRMNHTIITNFATSAKKRFEISMIMIKIAMTGATKMIMMMRTLMTQRFIVMQQNLMIFLTFMIMMIAMTMNFTSKIDDDGVTEIDDNDKYEDYDDEKFVCIRFHSAS